MSKHYLMISLILLLLANENINSQIVLDRFAEDRFKPIILFGIGATFGSSSEDFFDIYHEALGSSHDGVRLYPAGVVKYKTWLNPQIRLGMAGYLQSANFYEDYYDVGDFITRQHHHQIQLHSIPLHLTGEIIPYDKQFRSYIGLGAGIVISNINWKEKVNSSYSLDKRRNAVHFEESILSPSVSIFSGLELGFDEYPESEFLGSIIFELCFIYNFRNVDIFKNIKKQLADYPDSVNDKVLFFPASFNFNVALSFNLLSSN